MSDNHAQNNNFAQNNSANNFSQQQGNQQPQGGFPGGTPQQPYPNQQQGNPQQYGQQGGFPGGAPQQPYGQRPFGQGGFQGGQAGAQGFMGNGYPVKNPFNAQLLFKDPDQRWPLINALLGHYVVMAAFFAWASTDMFGDKIQITGISAGDGWFTLFLGIAIAVLNGIYLFNINLRGKIWVPITSIVLGAITALIAIINLSNVGGGVGAGFGLILTLLLGLGVVGISVMHLLELLKRKKMQF